MSSSDSDSCSSFQDDFERLMLTVKEFSNELEMVGDHLTKLQSPIERLCIDQLHTMEFLSSSPFRNESFCVKIPGLPGLEKGKRYPYKDICESLRKYLFRSNLVNTDGTIQTNAALKELLNVTTDTTTFLELMENLRKIVV